MAMRAILALGILLARVPGAYALDSVPDVSQYAHTAWKVSDGFTKGMIVTIAQTPDGYLWLGTEFGLYRFDGVRAVPWQPPTGQDLPSHNIYSLLVARDGALWIGTTNGVASWKDGKLTRYPQVDGQMIYALREDRDGTIWSGGAGGAAIPGPATLCAIGRSGVHCYGKDGNLGRGVVSSAYVDRKGDLWAVAGTGIWRWKPGPPKFYPLPMGPRPLEGFTEDDDGKLLIGIEGGLRRFFEGKIEAYPLPSTAQPFLTRTLLRDHDGGLWIAAYNAGLVHIHDGRADVFRQADGLSSDDVFALFEDRENNVWVSTMNGLDRFRVAAVTTFSLKEGLSNSLASSVVADTDGSVWVATPSGLDREREGQFTTYDKHDRKLNGSALTSLFQDSGGRIWVSTHGQFGYLEGNRFVPVGSAGIRAALCIGEDSAGNLWIADEQEGLFQLRGSKLVKQIPWIGLGHKDFALSLAADPLRGGIWLGFYEGGISHFAGGRVQETYTAADGLANGSVGNLQVERDGTLWAATDGGLARMKNGHFATLSRENGLPCDAIHWMIQGDDSFWLYSPCGLLRLARSEMDAWTAAVDRGEGAKQMVHPTVFDVSDGVRVHEVSNDRPGTAMVAKSLDGRIWFVSFDGISVIDPRHLPFNKVPPPVHIERITANDKTYDASNELRLPPRIRDLTIDYTALSFVVPEKVRFRYQLEGQDRNWREVANDREVQYSNLAPGNYVFRVIACNNSGVWNEAGDTLEFSIAQAYYQTNWFRGLCAAAVLGLVWGLYRLRLQQLQRRFNAGLEARASERTRIARELHDTLLQNLHGLMFQFQAARNMLPKRPDEAAQVMDSAIGATEQTITDSRSAIQHLRSELGSEGDLGQWLTATGQELARSPNANGNGPVFRLTVEGERKALIALPRDEIYRITREILRNAFQHAHASRIEAEIRYDDRELRVRIRDDGKGIDPQVLKTGGSAGHWGLRGMRERAQQIGARLDFWSEAGAGTEVELTVPAVVGYEKPRQRRRLRPFRKV
jgi:ligand-binding sensor domain-containing protein/signal transduction histidine kinase